MIDWPAWIGTLPGWITASGVVGFGGLMSRHYLRNKELGNQKEIRDRELEDEETRSTRAADRAEIGQLRGELRDMRAELDRQRISCELEQERLRAEIRLLHDEVIGIRRQRAAEQIAAVEVLPQVSEPIQRAMDSLRNQP